MKNSWVRGELRPDKIWLNICLSVCFVRDSFLNASISILKGMRKFCDTFLVLIVHLFYCFLNILFMC